MVNKTLCTGSSCLNSTLSPQALLRLFATQCAQIVQQEHPPAAPLVLEHLEAFSQKYLNEGAAPEAHSAQFPLTLLSSIQRLQEAIDACYLWVNQAPHGENCFLSEHYEQDPGNRCYCGKDALLQMLDALEQQPYAPSPPEQEEKESSRH